MVLCALLDFCYSGQAQRFSQASSLQVQTALKEFHENKSVILELKARVNPKGKSIDHWEIPELEFMQSVEPSICASGSIMQWTADIMEHGHITLVKDPAQSGNNHDFEIQICRSLDCLDHVRRFDLMTAMKDASIDFRLENVEGDEGQEQGAEGLQVDEEEDTELEITKILSTEKLVTHLNPVSKKLFRSFRPKQNFFLKARLLKRAPSAPLPHRSFVNNVTGEISAFSLVRDPDLTTQTIEEICLRILTPYSQHLQGLAGSLVAKTRSLFVKIKAFSGREALWKIIPQDLMSLRELGEQMGLLWEILFLFHNSVLLQIFVLSIEEILTLL
ncbi:hypothetical protein F5877DRAFT_71831 [Lentinula edodes]|nr:hypothetical protein F5877DRAFT_71831 [Lentinula edodes]